MVGRASTMILPAGCMVIGALLARVAAAEPLDPGSTLCLHPVVIPIDENKGRERRATVEKRLTEALVAASFEVPDPRGVADLIERVRTEGGGYVDAATGNRDEARFRAYRENAAAALRNEIGCDAQLFARVVHVRAYYGGTAADWDGTTDSVSSTGRVVLNALAGVRESGWVAALSLWLHAYGLDGDDLSFRTAGIESLVSLAVLRDQDLLPEDLWLTNLQKIDAAIQSALGPNGESLRLRGTPAGVAPAAPVRTEDQDRLREALQRPDSR